MSSPRFPSLPRDQVVDRVAPSVFCVNAGDSSGTGFVVSVGRSPTDDRSYTMVATAWHVVKNLSSTSQSLELVSHDGKHTVTDTTDRIGFLRLGPSVFDTALIYLDTANPLIESGDLLPVFPADSMLARGADVGWLGFPSIADPEICFFRGVISGYLGNPPTYLVDGVAINGVSGGPVFDDRCHLIGMVSAYIPNQLDEKTVLPGLAAITPINAIRHWMDNELQATDLSRLA